MPTTRAEQLKAGKALRVITPRSSHRTWQPAPDRPDTIRTLQAQDERRIKKLLPIKYGRMLVSPFTFFRGSTVMMAVDLVNTPVTGIAK